MTSMKTENSIGPSVVPSDMQAYIDSWNMSPALWAGDLLFLTGMTGAGPNGTVDSDPTQQIELAFQRTEHVLSEAGLDFSNVVEMTSYHVDLQSHGAEFRRIRAKYVKQPFPAWTAIEVAGFFTPGTICELRIVASRKGEFA